MYTHWEQKINARPGNFGSRIDFVLCSIAIKDWFREANIQEGLMGSDHCPVYAVTKERVPIQGDQKSYSEITDTPEETHILDLMNPQGMFNDGVRQREYSPTKDAPALSGRLLPEFTKRRNIRDMFSKKPVLAKPSAMLPANPDPNQAANGDQPPSSTIPDVPDMVPASQAEDHPASPATVVDDPTVSIPSPLNTSEKRRAPSGSPVKSVKRSKSSISAATNNAPSLQKGQQSLKGFFQSRSKPADPSPTKDTPPPLPLIVAHTPDPTPPSPSTYPQTDPLATQEASKESWTKLFSKKPLPRCEGHAEPCIILTTKKPGVNCGRQFWMCSRPIGPSGQKEMGTQWRCGTFVWASDWKG
jgi:AP endonuclease-2